MIRIATEADLSEILTIYAPYVAHTTASFEYTVPTMEAFTARFQNITRQFPWLVWEEKGKILGYAYGSAPFHRAGYAWCAEVSIYVHRSAHGRGIGKRLYAALEAILFRQGYHVIYAIITDENEGSLRFHEAAGYRTVAHLERCGWKFGRPLGIVYMEKRPESVETPSSSPIPWPQFVDNAINFSNFLDNLTLS